MHRDMQLLFSKKQLPHNIRLIPGITREELKKLYAEVDAFVLPSIEDGFGFVFGENSFEF